MAAKKKEAVRPKLGRAAAVSVHVPFMLTEEQLQARATRPRDEALASDLLKKALRRTDLAAFTWAMVSPDEAANAPAVADILRALLTSCGDADALKVPHAWARKMLGKSRSPRQDAVMNLIRRVRQCLDDTKELDALAHTLTIEGLAWAIAREQRPQTAPDPRLLPTNSDFQSVKKTMLKYLGRGNVDAELVAGALFDALGADGKALVQSAMKHSKEGAP